MELKNHKTPTKQSIPNWVDNYILKGENEIHSNLTSLNKKLLETQQAIEKNKKSVATFKNLKALFSTNGDVLESVVQLVLKGFGFEIEIPDNNRDDLIIKMDNKVGVVEVKGLGKSAAERNAAQLQKWVSNYHFENEFNPKGILIVNTFKNKFIEERTGDDFPHQMLPYAKQMKLCLITGIQLLYMYLDFQSGELNKEEIKSLLFNTTGVLTYKSQSKDLITKQK